MGQKWVKMHAKKVQFHWKAEIPLQISWKYVEILWILAGSVSIIQTPTAQMQPFVCFAFVFLFHCKCFCGNPILYMTLDFSHSIDGNEWRKKGWRGNNAYLGWLINDLNTQSGRNLLTAYLSKLNFRFSEFSANHLRCANR